MERTATSNTVITVPGRANMTAPAIIPLEPNARRPIDAAISTGSAPGVMLATITSLSIFCFVSIPCRSTISFSITGMRALPPPNPIHPIRNMDRINWPDRLTSIPATVLLTAPKYDSHMFPHPSPRYLRQHLHVPEFHKGW